MKDKLVSSFKPNEQALYDRRLYFFFYFFINSLITIGYINTFYVPLVFDDYATLVENTSIRSLAALKDVLSPPINPGLGWRPFANLTFALSYAISGLEPWAHHVFSILIHCAGALTLFGVVRHTLNTRHLVERFGKDATLLAGIIASLWAIDPLLTQTITYISQRTEALMGLLYLITLYGFIRGTLENKKTWYAISVVSCVLGVMSKEVIITAPVIVIIYDRIFLSNSFQESFEKRWKVYASLVASWIPFLILLKAIKHQAVGYGIGVTWYTYALTECKAVTTYFRLCLFPHPLIFDRGAHFLHSVSEALPYILGLCVLLGLSIYTLIKKPTLGFLGAWFFIILSPTSSVVPVAEVPIAENRIYLPLIALLSLIVIVVFHFLGKKVLTLIYVLLVGVFLFSTYERNKVYASSISLWKDTVSKDPNNPRALNDLGFLMLKKPEYSKEAEYYFKEALRLKPHYSDALSNLGMLYADNPTKASEAIELYQEAIKYNDENAEAHSCYANLIAQIPGKKSEAILHMKRAISLKPYNADFHNNYAAIIAGDPTTKAEAIKEYKLAITLNPNYAEAHNNLANLYAQEDGKENDAIFEYRKAIACDPSLSFVHFNLGLLLKQHKDSQQDAINEFRLALKLRPNDAPPQLAIIHCNIGLLQQYASNYQSAIDEYKSALKIYPLIPLAYVQLARIYEILESSEADIINCYENAIRLDGKNDEIHQLFGKYLSKKYPKRAINEYREALKLNPNNSAAKDAIKLLK